MARFFFTFGTDRGFPFYRGHVEVLALDERDAVAAFRQHYPDRTPGIINCAFVYPEARFKDYGEKCHAGHCSAAYVEKRSRLQARLADASSALTRMQDRNDGSLAWVDDVRALFAEVQAIEDALAAL